MFAAGDWVGGDSDEAEDAGGGGGDAVRVAFGVFEDFGFGCTEGGEDADGDACGAAGGEDIDVDGVAERADAVAGLAPVAEAIFPELGLGVGEFVRGFTFSGGVFLVDPWAEGRAGEVWEG